MKNYTVLIIGIVLLIVSFIWMIISRSSTGIFLILGGAGGAVITEGIFQVKKKR